MQASEKPTSLLLANGSGDILTCPIVLPPTRPNVPGAFSIRRSRPLARWLDRSSYEHDLSCVRTNHHLADLPLIGVLIFHDSSLSCDLPTAMSCFSSFIHFPFLSPPSTAVSHPSLLFFRPALLSSVFPFRLSLLFVCSSLLPFCPSLLFFHPSLLFFLSSFLSLQVSPISSGCPSSLSFYPSLFF